MVITIDPSVITHTLPDHFTGINQGVLDYDDMSSTYYRQVCIDAGFEIFRAFTVQRGMNYGFYNVAKDFCAYMQGQLGSAFCAMLGTPIMPDPQPTGAAFDLDPIPDISTAANHSLTALRAEFAEWIDAGIDIKWWQYVNEPHLNSFDQEHNATAGGGTPWFYQGGDLDAPPLGLRLMANDWTTIKHREAKAAFDAEISAKGRTGQTIVVANAEANIVSDSGYDLVKRFVLGTLFTGGVTNPNSPASNVSFLPLLTVHSYRGGGILTDQESLNETFYDGGETEAQYLTQSPPKGGLKLPLRLMRALLDANGGSAVPLAYDEAGSDNKNGANVPQKNFIEMIACIQAAAAVNLRYHITHAMSRSHTTSNDEQFLMADENSPYPFGSLADVEPGRRYYAYKDGWGRFPQIYKKLVQVTINTAAGNTPSANHSNSVPRIQLVAGLNAAEDTLGILLSNIDLTTTEQLTVNLTNASADGNIVGFKCPRAQGHSALPAITPFGNGVSAFTTGSGGAPSIATGDSYLLEIPLEVQEGGAVGSSDAPTIISIPQVRGVRVI